MDLDKQEICIRSDIIKRFINRSVEKERYLFLAMCSNQDADRVLGKLKMETKDFERLSFLISQLGFYSLGMSFDMEHQDLLENIGTAIETDIGYGCVDEDSFMGTSVYRSAPHRKNEREYPESIRTRIIK